MVQRGKGENGLYYPPRVGLLAMPYSMKGDVMKDVRWKVKLGMVTSWKCVCLNKTEFQIELLRLLALLAPSSFGLKSVNRRKNPPDPGIST